MKPITDRYVENVYAYLDVILPQYAAPTIIEIGAARGEDTALMHNLNGRGRYLAFEPEPRNLTMLRDLQLPNIEIIPMAVGNVNGPLTFHQSSGWNPHAGDRQKYDHSLSGSIRTPKNHLNIAPWCAFNSSITVECVRLDDFCAANGVYHVDFIWCDIQGAEIDFINGATNVLKTLHYLYMEYNDSEMYEGQPNLDELMSHLPGYELVHRFPDDVLLWNTRSDAR